MAKLPSPGALLFAGIPILAMCFTVPLWDRVYPLVFGLPFNLFWLVSWNLLTPLFMWKAYRIETSHRKTLTEKEGKSNG
jgi:hypothetical protein